MTDFDEMIESAEADLARCDVEIRRLLGEFQAATRSWLVDEWTTTVERAVREQHEHTASLERSTLSNMKDSLASTVAAADDYVSQAFVSDTTSDDWVYYGHNAPKQVDAVLRRLLGKIAPVLADNGYQHSFEGGAERWRFRYAMNLSEPMRAVMANLSHTFSERGAAQRKLDDATKTKAETEAQDLWDSL